jgi:alpha-ribazole phosphatase
LQQSRQCWAIDLPHAAVLSLRIWPGELRSAQIVGLAA